MIDNELSIRFKENTGMDFETFYAKYRPKLVWYLTRYTKDQERAEDFADDAFTQALLKINNYNKDKSQIHTWLYKIGENLVKKDYKDRKKLFAFSIDGSDNNNDNNLSIINIIPSDDINNSEHNLIDKKAEIVKETIFNLPEKYKKVMIMREIENKPYLEIAELCSKKYNININNEVKELPDVNEFLNIFINNKGKEDCYITFTHKEQDDILEIKVNPGDTFHIDKSEISNLSKLEIKSNDYVEGIYKTSTNLSTIKSQISKGRQLIQNMVKHKFKILEEEDGIH